MKTIFGGPVDPYVETRVTKFSGQYLITEHTNIQQGNKVSTSFSYMARVKM